MPSHSRHAVILDTAAEGVSPVTLGATIRLMARLAAEVSRIRTTGEIYPRHIAINSLAPDAEIESYALQDWLDEIALTGKAITADGDNDGLELYFQKFDEDAGPAGSGHRVLTMKKGLIVPDSISVSHQQDATIKYRALIVWDGTNLPIVVGDSATLPSTPNDNERFTIGPVTFGGVAITQVTQININFGVIARVLGEDSDVYPTRVEIRGIEPTISITTTDATIMKTGGVPLNGLACTHANTAIYLRKRAQSAAHFVADATAEHLKFTAYGIATCETADEQGGDEPASATITLPCAFDGTNTPLTIDTTSALP